MQTPEITIVCDDPTAQSKKRQTSGDTSEPQSKRRAVNGTKGRIAIHLGKVREHWGHEAFSAFQNSGENMLRGVTKLLSYPWSDVYPLLEAARQQRQNNPARGSSRLANFQPRDVETALLKLKRPGEEASHSSLFKKRRALSAATGQLQTAPNHDGHDAAKKTTQDQNGGHTSNGPLRPLFHLSDHDMRSIQGQGWLNDHVIYATLTIFQEAVGRENLCVVDPLHNSLPTDVGSSALLLLPRCIDRHWVLGAMDRSREALVIYDSLPSQGCSAKERMLGILAPISPSPLVYETAPCIQDNGYDCGIYLLISALYTILGQPVPHRADASSFRPLFTDLLSLSDIPDPDSSVIHLTPIGGGSIVASGVSEHWSQVKTTLQTMAQGLDLTISTFSKFQPRQSSPWTPNALFAMQQLVELAQSSKSDYKEEILGRLRHVQKVSKHEIARQQILRELQQCSRELEAFSSAVECNTTSSNDSLSTPGHKSSISTSSKSPFADPATSTRASSTAVGSASSTLTSNHI